MQPLSEITFVSAFFVAALRASVGADYHSALCFGFFDLAGDEMLEAAELQAVLETMSHSAACQSSITCNDRAVETIAECVERVCGGPSGRIDERQFSAKVVEELQGNLAGHPSAREQSVLLIACNALRWECLLGIGV